jgi:hypothetical protein
VGLDKVHGTDQYVDSFVVAQAADEEEQRPAGEAVAQTLRVGLHLGGYVNKAIQLDAIVDHAAFLPQGAQKWR